VEPLPAIAERGDENDGEPEVGGQRA
jgi:hypothetical protein